MKIALIIFRIGPSHGSILQTYALHKVLTDMGHEVDIIDRQPPVDIIGTIKSCISRLVGRLNGGYFGPIFYSGGYSNTSMKKITHFVKQHLAPYLYTIRSAKDVQKLATHGYDAFVVGSDQTWRPKYVYDIYYYFLDFLSEYPLVKKVAYAPSFGTNQWEFDSVQTMRCKLLVKKFNAVSVREKDGVRLCKKYLDVDPTLVQDPTLLLSQDDYSQFLCNNISNERYIAYSLLDDNPLYGDILDKISFYYKLDTKRINSNIGIRKHKSDFIEPGIEQWLKDIHNSDMVVTDSFHATVFSILFNKPFITIGNNSRGISRLQSLLEGVNLSHRLIKDVSDLTDSLLNKQEDWKSINDILKSKRDSSIEFLLNSLK